MPGRDTSVAVIGFGYVGTCIGAVLASKGSHVIGIDTNPRVVTAIRAGHSPISEPGLDELLGEVTGNARLEITDDLQAAAEAETVLMTVGTPLADDGSIDDSALKGACLALAKVLRPGQLVILKSTVTPGFTREVAGELLATSGLRPGVDFSLAFCPERLAEGTALEEIRTLPVLVSGVSPTCKDRAEQFWQDHLGVGTHAVSSVEAAELVKLATNWWIDHNIALANELAQYCDLFEADVMDVIHAANELPKGAGQVNILLPSVGVGGSCLTKDPWIAWSVARDYGVHLGTVQAARSANDNMPSYAVETIAAHLDASNVYGMRIAALGMAFKNNTGDVRHSPAVETIRQLVELGAEVRIHDPRVLEDDVPEDLKPLVMTQLGEVLHDADCVAFLAGHEEYRRLTAAEIAEPVAPGALIFDGRMYFERSVIAELESLGLRFTGIGRSGAPAEAAAKTHPASKAA